MSSTRPARLRLHPTYVAQVKMVLIAFDAMDANEREQTLTLMALTANRHLIANWSKPSSHIDQEPPQIRVLGKAVS